MSEVYREAGVDIAAGDEATARYRAHTTRAWRPEALTALGGFGGAFALPVERYPDPVLVSGTDGVGTKLKIGFALGRHDTIGVDCVAMCVNDISVMGAEPLFFLDYLAMNRLDPLVAEEVVRGVADGCAQAGCALIGGETAEMPGMYHDGEYDLAGFAVGVVQRERLVDGSAIADGDVVVGLASSGLHSNGFSLVRKLIQDAGIALDAPAPGGTGDRTLGEDLLTPTRIYSPTALALCREFPVHGMAHITGGGLTENVPRILHRRWDVTLDLGSWRAPPIFPWLARLGDLGDDDLFRVFNMGVGFTLIIPAEVADGVVARANDLGESAARIGVVRAGSGQVQRQGSWWDVQPRDAHP
jgi:phosphoribosylformylglycinamidine cyclo-ligase